MNPGTSVRLISDPGRQGITTGKQRKKANRLFWQVAFPDSYQFISEKQLEIVNTSFEDAYDLFSQGKIGRAKDLRGAITHIRLSGRLADLIYSMETTNTDFYAYQFKPVLKFLESPSGGMLIADEVGLGKTIEAGLIWTELRSRYDARRLMVLCPAMLREKWALELKKRFDISADVADAEAVLNTFQLNSSGDLHEFSLVASMQGLRPNRKWEEDTDIANKASTRLASFLDKSAHDQPLIDLLIVDEAHYLRNQESMTSRLGRLLRNVADNVLLLSATPIHLKNENLYQLLNIVDEDSFNQLHVFDDILQANAPLIKARDMILQGSATVEEFIEKLKEAKLYPLLKNNRQLQLIIDNPPSQKDLQANSFRSEMAYSLENINLLGHAVTRTRKREVTEWRVVRDPVPEIVTMSDPEKEFYEEVTDLVRQYCSIRDVNDGFLLVTPQRQISSSMPAALRVWQQRKLKIGQRNAELLYEDLGQDPVNSQEMGPLVQTIIENAEKLGNLDELWENDSKYQRLSTELKKYLKDNPKDKIVVFAYFRPTLYYLHERLTAEGIKSQVLVGGGGGNKYETIEKFRDPKGPSVLLASEVASEGVDLQFSRVLVNYDLPWNPMKVEQRIGRIDRIGQKSPKISIWNLFYANTIDARIHERLYQRLKVFEYALGGFEAVIGEEIKKMTNDLIKATLSPAQEEERISQTQQAISNLRDEEERLEQNANNLIAHGDYILNKVNAARQLGRWITDEDLWIYVRDYFRSNYQGCEFRQLKADELIFDVRLSEQACFELEQFIQAQRLQGQTRMAQSSFKPVRCQFKNQVPQQNRVRHEYINQFHPVVRFVSKEINKRTGRSEIVYFPAVSLRLDHKRIPGQTPRDFVFYARLWTIKGMKDIERLVFFVKPGGSSSEFLSDEKAEQLVTTAAKYGSDWLSAPNEVKFSEFVPILEYCMETEETRYERYIERVENENNDRADLQEETLKLHLARQKKKLKEIMQRHKEKGHLSMIAPTQGKIDRLESKVRGQLRMIQEKRKLKHSTKDVCLGIIRLD
jgi:superfamily II DNA or RNA helicase